MNTTIGDVLPAEIKRVIRVRDDYVALRAQPNVNVEPAIAQMDRWIDTAIDALATRDLIGMVDAYCELKRFAA
jgi:hypothetical protein